MSKARVDAVTAAGSEYAESEQTALDSTRILTPEVPQTGYLTSLRTPLEIRAALETGWFLSVPEA